ncbi:hypothetical protein [Kyrpidia spormannii]|uniref:Cytochrome oxidase subunit I profile domain-containing protein n=1 Tax=Kyrpidia spormannii TaxID=2055160 RepID=A0A6F9EFA5_9BACL|nr:hypothetical protein [Kyrpidia spormannii]CAB3395188.1 membrane protein of unknown function [Kyrpidia spormannii]
MGVTEGRSVPWYPQNNFQGEAAVLPGFDEKLHHAGAGTMDGVRGAGARAGASEGLGPRFRITRVYMITGLVFLGATWALLVAAAPAIAQGAWADSFPLAAIHLFVVGYALTTVHGALLQITPVAFQGRLYSIRLGYIEYVLMVLGAVAIPLGFLCRLWMITAIGGLFVLGAFALLLWNLGCTARTLKKRGEAFRSAWVFIFLLAVLILGVGMALGVPLLGRASLLLHMVAGVTGWFTTLILILSPRLIRVLVSSRHPGLERRGPELGLMAGTLLIAIGVSLVLAPGPGAGMGLWGVAGSLSVGIGWVLYLVAYGLLLFHLFQHLRYRRRRDLEWVIPWIAAGLAAGWPVTLAWGGGGVGSHGGAGVYGHDAACGFRLSRVGDCCIYGQNPAIPAVDEQVRPWARSGDSPGPEGAAGGSPGYDAAGSHRSGLVGFCWRCCFTCRGFLEWPGGVGLDRGGGRGIGVAGLRRGDVGGVPAMTARPRRICPRKLMCHKIVRFCSRFSRHPGGDPSV